MSQPDTTSRIPLTANRVRLTSSSTPRIIGSLFIKGVTGALFGLAIITYGIRTYIRACILKQFSAEDVVLLLGVVCLCGATSLAYLTMNYHYDVLAVILQSRKAELLFDLVETIPTIAKEENAASTLWWFVIFPVKLAYLLFFRRLISRVHNLNIWWWIVVIFTVAAGCTCLAASWLTCPYFTIEEVLCE